MNSKRKGSLAVGHAIAYFINNNCSVFIPVSDCDKYDLVIDQNGSFQKVQCKYSGSKAKSGGFIVDLRTFGGYRDKTYYIRYGKDDFNLLFVYCSNGDKYLIPEEKVRNMSGLAVGGKSWNEYKLS